MVIVKMSWLQWLQGRKGKMFKKRTNNINRNIEAKLRRLKPLPREAYNYFVKTTPIKTGNARKSTELILGNTIDANYNYANRLNEGASRQARNGMTQPTVSFLRRRVRQLLG